jgi:hypothetical protein
MIFFFFFKVVFFARMLSNGIDDKMLRVSSRYA